MRIKDARHELRFHLVLHLHIYEKKYSEAKLHLHNAARKYVSQQAYTMYLLYCEIFDTGSNLIPRSQPGWSEPTKTGAGWPGREVGDPRLGPGRVGEHK